MSLLLADHSSANNPLNVINATINQHSVKNWLHIPNVEHADHDYYLQFPLAITEYKNEVITYIAGYILRTLMKTVHCTECVGALIQQSTHINSNLINIKNKGSLLYPSKDLVYICKQVENTIRTYLSEEKTLNNFNMNIFVLHVMNKFIHVGIFDDLKEHISDQCFFSNHVNHLLRLIVQLYTKTRLAHHVQNVHISDRHKLHKLILFKGM